MAVANPARVPERFVIECEGQLSHGDREEIRSAMDKWISGEQPTLILRRGVHVRQLNTSQSVGQRCKYCGLYNHLERIRCEGCNAKL